MNKWQLRFHVTMTVGGSFTGLAIGLMMLVDNWGQLKATAIVLVMAFCLVCVWGISLGLRLAEGRNQGRELRLFYLVQVPYFSAPWFSYHLGFGLMLYLGTLQNGRYIQAQLGADWQTALPGSDGFFFAINMVPIAALITLKRFESSLEPSV